MTIEQYANGLAKLRDTLPAKVDEILMKNSNFITGMLKLRLYNYGQDGDYEQIGFYSPKTQELKKKKGQKTTFITLRDTGSFYAGMYLESKNGEYKIDSTARQTQMLIAEYGPEILQLTYKQQTDIINNIINPELQKYIDESLGDIDITF
jgi:hypothetical protein